MKALDRSADWVKKIAAQCAVGARYDCGFKVKRDKIKVAELFRLAAIAGDEMAQLSYELDLYYGSNGIEKDIDLGMKYIRLSADGE